jgi:hypothetical protein
MLISMVKRWLLALFGETVELLDVRKDRYNTLIKDHLFV